MSGGIARSMRAPRHRDRLFHAIVIMRPATLGVGFYHRIFGDISGPQGVRLATERLPMRHIRNILRLKWTLRRSHRETARSLGISAGAVASVVTRAKALALTWETVSALSDDALERTLYGPKLALTVAQIGRAHV